MTPEDAIILLLAERAAGARVIGRQIELGIALEDLVHGGCGDAEVLAHPSDLVGKGDLDRMP